MTKYSGSPFFGDRGGVVFVNGDPLRPCYSARKQVTKFLTFRQFTESIFGQIRRYVLHPTRNEPTLAKRRNLTWSVVNFRLEWHLFVTTTGYSHTLRQPVTLFSTAIMISASASDFTFLFWKIHIGAVCQSERTRHWSFSNTWSSIVFTWIKCVTRNLFWIGFFVIHQVVSLFHKWNDDKTKIVGTNKNFVFVLFGFTHKGDAS